MSASFTIERSILSIPASNWRMIEKGVASDADVAFLDLEDAVAPSVKVESRAHVVRAFRELDWGAKPPAYRINGLSTPFFYRDVVDVVEQAGDRLRLIIMPKVQRPEDVIALDILLTAIERCMGFDTGRIRLGVQIESASGLLHSDRIAAASPRIHSLDFGPGDFAAGMRMPAVAVGAKDDWDRSYPGHRYHYAMERIVVAARAAGVLAIDGPNAQYRDLEAFRQSCLQARALGFDGKWCIHPAQIPVANEVFSPTAQELAWARKVVAAYEEALQSGSGAISVEGAMVDEASVKMARSVLDLARRMQR